MEGEGIEKNMKCDDHDRIRENRNRYNNNNGYMRKVTADGG